ncbi:hypothetical protein BA190_24365 [Labrys sp. WJW]|nr:hypothetical protein BA190_24365 [Labrys sp. WJW]
MGLVLQEPDMPLPTHFNIFAFADDASLLPACMPGMGVATRSQCKGAGRDLSNANRMIVARLAQDHTRI